MTAISPNVVVTVLLKLKEERLGKCCCAVAQPYTNEKPLVFNLKCKSLNSHFASVWFHRLRATVNGVSL